MKLATTILVFCVTALLALGLVMLYSSSMSDHDGTRNFLMQLIWCSLGLVACVVAATVDHRLLKKMAWPLFGLAIVLLVLVPIVGTKINGARRWIHLPIGGVNLQPSEAAKLALILALAWYGDYFQRRMTDWKRGVLLPGLFIGLTLGLIFIEPDRGTTILLGCVTGAMLLLAGVRWKHLVLPAFAAVGLMAVSILCDPVRRERVLAWIHPDLHKSGVGLQADRAMLALGSGGWMGVGLGNSRQKLGYLPFHNTDFILPIIGEELGLIATLLVLLAFLLIVLCGFHIASRSPDTFGLLLGTGVTLMIGLQAVINIAVVTNVFPNKGIPLPFISYGGSNLFIMLTGIGLLIGTARRARVGHTAKDTALDHGEIPSPQLS
jgi:cell division protein FtsW